jgi:HEPN domain-containing protein
MHAIDETLAGRELKPFQRPLHVPRLLWEAFGWSGNVLPPDSLADQPGFSSAVLMAKAHRWYKDFYGDQLFMPGVVGHFPYRIGNAVWKVRAPVVFGSVTFFVDPDLSNQGSRMATRGVAATANILRQVEKLPQGLASRLRQEQLAELASFFQFAMNALMWRQELRAPAFEVAYADYDASTEDVVGGRYGQARWGAQQAVEKTFKGLLGLAGKQYPTGGPNGHNLKHLAGLMKGTFGVEIAEGLLNIAGCSAAVRYGEEPSCETQALSANHAVLGVFEQLSKNAAIAQLLANQPASGA